MEKKKCSGPCGLIKNLDEFGKNKKSPDGLNYICKECASAYRKQHHAKNKERDNAQQRDYYHNGGGKEVSAAYRQSHKEQKSEYMKKRNKDPAIKKARAEYMKEYMKEYYPDNREKCLEKGRERHRNNINNPNYIASQMWKHLNERCQKHPNYVDVDVVVERDEFIEWAVPELEEFFKLHPNEDLNPNERPELHRVNNCPYYKLGEMQIITKAAHRELHPKRRNEKGQFI